MATATIRPFYWFRKRVCRTSSLLFRLSATDILRYWSLLTQEQRAAFLEARAPEVALLGQGADLVARAKLALEKKTLFDRFAGFFHAFGCLERSSP